MADLASSPTPRMAPNYGVAPYALLPASPSTFTQTYASAASAVPAATGTAVASTGSGTVVPWGYTTAAQADGLVTAVNALVADSLANRQLINAIIDVMQAAGLAL